MAQHPAFLRARAPRLLLAAALGIAVVACRPAGPPAPTSDRSARTLDTSVQAPVRAVALEDGERRQRLLAFLRQRYGEQASLDDAWSGTWHDPEVEATRPVHRHVCADQAVPAGENGYSLLAVCTNLDDAANIEPGRIDFLVLAGNAAGGMDVVAQRLADSHGSRGVPGDVSVLQLGAERHGFRIESGWFGQGHALISQSLLMFDGRGLQDAGWLRSHIDNGAAYDCETDDCEGRVFDVDFRLRADDSQPQRDVWPLQVSETGRDCDGPVTRQHVLDYDPTRAGYRIADALQREGCG